jgi:hypothetical protein
MIDKILYKEYEEISEWEGLFIIWKIKKIDIQDIVTAKTEWKKDFKDVIRKEIWKKDYDNLSDEEKKLLNELFSYVWEYCTDNGITNWTLESFLSWNTSIRFNDWLGKKKEEFENEKTEKTETKSEKEQELEEKWEQLWTLDEQQTELEKINEIWENIQSITTPTSLIWEGIEICGNEKLSFDVGNQQINIWDKKYKVDFTYNWDDAKLTNITIQWDEVVIEGTKEIFLIWEQSREKKISKELFQLWIQEIYQTWNYSFQDWGIAIIVTPVNNPPQTPSV